MSDSPIDLNRLKFHPIIGRLLKSYDFNPLAGLAVCRPARQIKGPLADSLERAVRSGPSRFFNLA